MCTTAKVFPLESFAIYGILHEFKLWYLLTAHLKNFVLHPTFLCLEYALNIVIYIALHLILVELVIYNRRQYQPVPLMKKWRVLEEVLVGKEFHRVIKVIVTRFLDHWYVCLRMYVPIIM